MPWLILGSMHFALTSQQRYSNILTYETDLLKPSLNLNQQSLVLIPCGTQPKSLWTALVRYGLEARSLSRTPTLAAGYAARDQLSKMGAP